MFLVQGVHYPDANKERALIEAIHTFGALVRTQPGALFVDVFKTANDGTILSLAIWESKQAFQTAWATLSPRALPRIGGQAARDAHHGVGLIILMMRRFVPRRTTPGDA